MIRKIGFLLVLPFLGCDSATDVDINGDLFTDAALTVDAAQNNASAQNPEYAYLRSGTDLLILEIPLTNPATFSADEEIQQDDSDAPENFAIFNSGDYSEDGYTYNDGGNGFLITINPHVKVLVTMRDFEDEFRAIAFRGSFSDGRLRGEILLEAFGQGVVKDVEMRVLHDGDIVASNSGEGISIEVQPE